MLSYWAFQLIWDIKGKKVGLKWLKMDFKGMYFIFFSRKLPPPETPTHPLIENSIIFFNPSLSNKKTQT